MVSSSAINQEIDHWYYYMNKEDRDRLGACAVSFWSREGVAHCEKLIDNLASQFGFHSLQEALDDEFEFEFVGNDYNLLWRMCGFSVVTTCANAHSRGIVCEMASRLLQNANGADVLRSMQGETIHALRTYGTPNDG